MNEFNFISTGKGVPLIFQHGMGANLSQPQTLLSELQGVNLISMDSRGHGKTLLDDPLQISFNQFADDVVHLVKSLKISRAIFGGISMGAGIALNISFRYPEFVKALVMVRPAWLDRPQELPIYSGLIDLIRKNKGIAIAETEEFKLLSQLEPKAVQAILGQLNREQAEHTADIIDRMMADQPIHELSQLKELDIPVLILSSHQDFLHPFDFGLILSQYIPHAEFKEVPSRYVHNDLHKSAVTGLVQEFLIKHQLM